MSLVAIKVPDIGDFKDVTVIEIMVKPGDPIRLEQSLMTVESDKAAMEIPASHAGVLKELNIKLGDKVNVGDLIGMLEATAAPTPAPAAVEPAPLFAVDAPLQKNEQNVPIAQINSAQEAPVLIAESLPSTAPSVPPVAPPAATVSTPPAQPAHQPGTVQAGLPHASPSVRKFARELGVPLSEVKGSGLKGRILDADVQAFSRAVMSGAVQTQAAAQQAKTAPPETSGDGAGLGLLPWPQVDFAKFGPTERKAISRIKKISAANLHRNWVMIPHVTNHDDCDITELEAFRVAINQENERTSSGAGQGGVKVTMLAFLVKACVAALKKFPDFNASLDGDQLVLKQYFHIAFAADTPNGLMVPVIKNADQKGIFQISQEMSELAKKARDGKLSPSEMQGGCFTISSLGGIGGRYFTPIINAPEVAILGVCKSQMEPVWDGKAFAPRLMLPLSLSWDHRVIDGAAAARFNAYLGQILGDFRRVLL
ncbi:MAG: dihydrolipoyllysine-residue acetyltransferase [Rhodoferax sp.]|nr:dihydrolipoyllysine-residue acetyltransferase [Rhodoferax sp.]